MKNMKRFLAVVLVVLAMVGGCSVICKFSPAQRSQVSDSLHKLQGGYEIMVAILQANSDPRVQVAVALTDAGLNMAGQMLDSWCPSEQELALLQATVNGAEKAKVEAGLP